MSRSTVLLTCALLLGVAATTAYPATYQGRPIDAHSWHCVARTNDYGKFPGCEVRFDGERAYLTLSSGLRIVLILEDEHILDPHGVVGYDHKRGLRWELDILDLPNG